MTGSGPSLFLASSSWILVKAVVSGIVTHAAAPLPTQPGHKKHLQNLCFDIIKSRYKIWNHLRLLAGTGVDQSFVVEEFCHGGGGDGGGTSVGKLELVLVSLPRTH